MVALFETRPWFQFFSRKKNRGTVNKFRISYLPKCALFRWRVKGCREFFLCSRFYSIKLTFSSSDWPKSYFLGFLWPPIMWIWNPFLRLFYLKLLTRTSIESEPKNFRTGATFEVYFLHSSATLFLCALFLVSFERIFNLKSIDMSSVFNGGHSMEYEVFQQILLNNEYFSRCQKEFIFIYSSISFCLFFVWIFFLIFFFFFFLFSDMTEFN